MRNWQKKYEKNPQNMQKTQSQTPQSNKHFRECKMFFKYTGEQAKMVFLLGMKAHHFRSVLDSCQYAIIFITVYQIRKVWVQFYAGVEHPKLFFFLITYPLNVMWASALTSTVMLAKLSAVVFCNSWLALK